MRTIKASEFKAKCLKLMDEVAASGEPLEITKNGRPIVRLVPLAPQPKKSLGGAQGADRDQGRHHLADRRRLGSEPLILLDTHSLVWLDQAVPTLGETTRGMVDQALRSGTLAVSAMTFWEVAMLLAKGRLEIQAPAAAWRRDLLTNWRLVELPVTGEIGVAAVELSGFHADPIDRLIVATARAHAARLVTADRQILAWSGDLDRQDARS